MRMTYAYGQVSVLPSNFNGNHLWHNSDTGPKISAFLIARLPGSSGGRGKWASEAEYCSTTTTILVTWLLWSPSLTL